MGARSADITSHTTQNQLGGFAKTRSPLNAYASKDKELSTTKRRKIRECRTNPGGSNPGGVVSGFNEGDHPRHPAGSPQGGEFASKGGRTFATTEEADAWGLKNQGWLDDATNDDLLGISKYTTVVGINNDLRANRPVETDRTRYAANLVDDLDRPYMKEDGSGQQERNPDGSLAYWQKLEGGISDKMSLDALDKTFRHPEAKLKEPVVTHRAWTGNSRLRDMEIGTTFTDKGFGSTALAQKEIDVFFRGKSGGVECEIRVPAGTRAIYLGAHPPGLKAKRDRGRNGIVEERPWYAASSELLLDRRTQYRVVGKGVTASGRTKLILEVVGQKEKK